MKDHLILQEIKKEEMMKEKLIEKDHDILQEKKRNSDFLKENLLVIDEMIDDDLRKISEKENLTEIEILNFETENLLEADEMKDEVLKKIMHLRNDSLIENHIEFVNEKEVDSRRILLQGAVFLKKNLIHLKT